MMDSKTLEDTESATEPLLLTEDQMKDGEEESSFASRVDDVFGKVMFANRNTQSLPHPQFFHRHMNGTTECFMYRQILLMLWNTWKK